MPLPLLEGFKGDTKHVVRDLDNDNVIVSTKPNQQCYILNALSSTVDIASKSVKIGVDSCKELILKIHYDPLTSTLEICNSEHVHVYLEQHCRIQTISIDKSDDITIHVNDVNNQIWRIYWHNVSDVNVDTGYDYVLLDKVPGQNKNQIFQHVCEVQEGGTFDIQPVLRENGIPTTEAEKKANDEVEKKLSELLLKQVIGEARRGERAALTAAASNKSKES